jgi:hypothetical protein
MVGKKGASKGKGKESKPAATTGDGWRISKLSKADLKKMVDECLLQPKEITQWRSATSDKRPYEGDEEIVFFSIFFSADWPFLHLISFVAFSCTMESYSIISTPILFSTFPSLFIFMKPSWG